MNENRANIFSIVFIIFFVFMMLSPCWLGIMETVNYSETSEESLVNYFHITDVESTAVVVDEPGSEGKVVITERLTFDIHGAAGGEGIWEIWRTLPEATIDGVPVYYKVNSVKQIMSNGTEVVWEESPQLYWYDSDYISSDLGPGKWFHSEGPYNESQHQYECLMLYLDGVYNDEMTFEIEYERYNTALKYNDCSDLYFPLIGDHDLNHLDSFKAEILFPDKDMPAQGDYYYVTYGTNDYQFPVTESATANPGYYTFTIDLDKKDMKFKPHTEYLEFDLVAYGDSKNIFTEYAPDNMWSEWDCLAEIKAEQDAFFKEKTTFNLVKLAILGLSLIGSALIIVFALSSGALVVNKYNICEPSVDIKLFRDIPSNLDPNFAAALVFARHKKPKDDSGVYSALLLSLARKKYIELRSLSGGTVEIVIKKRPNNASGNRSVSAEQPANISAAENTYYEPLTMCEEYYYNLLIRHAVGDTILLSTFQYRVSKDYVNTDSFVRSMERSIVNIGIKEGYLQKADYTQPMKKVKGLSTFIIVCGVLMVLALNLLSFNTRVGLAFGAYFVLGIACIVAAIILRIKSRKYILLTQFGVEEYEKWRGLYDFLNSDTLMSERTFTDLPVWEKYLVYATAFGLSEKISKAISIRCPEAPQSEMLSNPCYRSSSFHHASGRAFRSATRSASRIARSGGGYGGGRGGYGGGGGQ